MRAVLEGGRFQWQEGAGPGGGVGKLPALELELGLPHTWHLEAAATAQD